MFSWVWRRRELAGIAAIPHSSALGGPSAAAGKSAMVMEEKGLGKGKGKVLDAEVAYEK